MEKINIDLENTAELSVENLKSVTFPEEPEMNDGNSPKNPKKKKRFVFKKDTTVLNVIMTILTVLANILVLYLLFGTTRFSAVSRDLFIKINIGVLIALLIIDVLIIFMIRTKKIYLFVISLLCGAVFIAVGGYGVYALSRVNKSIDKVTATVVEEDVAASFVIYDGTAGDPITNVSDLNGRNIGIASDSKTGEIAKVRLDSEGISANIIELPGYQEVFTNLLNGTVDCAVLPVTYASQFEEDPAFTEYLSSTSSILDFSDTVSTTNDSGADKDITKEPFTVLLTGENEGLADTIILASVNPVSMQVVMTSIARDSFVPITCYGGVSSKINSAHAVSESCMVATVEKVMGVKIDYTVEFNFASVIQVVDAVGGVDVYNREAFYGQCWDIETDSLVVLPIPYGDDIVHMNGQEALGFARERMAFADGDFARQRNQQQVIENVVSKILAAKDPSMLLKILDVAGNNIKTNFTVEQMTSFVKYALSKSKRYYNQENIAGLINFVTSRVFGYNVMMWDDSLNMYLYTYHIFNGSVSANRNAIERNANLYAAYSVPASVSWNASTTYTPNPVSAEYYGGEVTETVVGGPSTTTEQETTPEETIAPTVTPEVVQPTPETPVPTPEPEPTPEVVQPEPEAPAPEPAPVSEEPVE